jgi:hypothetical protein
MLRHVYIEKEVSRVFTNEDKQRVVLSEECCCISAVVRHGIIYHTLQGICSVAARVRASRSVTYCPVKSNNKCPSNCASYTHNSSLANANVT